MTVQVKAACLLLSVLFFVSYILFIVVVMMLVTGVLHLLNPSWFSFRTFDLPSLVIVIVITAASMRFFVKVLKKYRSHLADTLSRKRS